RLPMLGAGHHGIAGLELRALRQHQVHLRGRTQRKHLKAVRMAGDDVQCAGADGPRGAQYGESLFLHHCIAKLVNIMARGSVGSRASTRSSTPPWPGRSPLLSLTPALRLMRDSTRSPETLMATMNSTA